MQYGRFLYYLTNNSQEYNIRVLRNMYLPMKNYQFSIVVEKNSDGYFVNCPTLQGCYSQGDTYEEAIRNIEDAIRLHLADRSQEDRNVILEPEMVSVRS